MPTQPSRSLPNIIYINSHDTGRYIQPFGHALPTPNLQQLAEQGTLFRQAYCCNPTCSASRSALVTGQYPHCNGMTGLAHRGFSLTNPRHHLLFTLQAAGYQTVLAGDQHVTTEPEEFGYDRVFADLGSGDQNAVDFLREPPSQPFYLELGFGQTHRSYPDSTGEIDAKYCLPIPYFPDRPELRREAADYALCVRQLDERMGRVFDAVHEAGLDETTLIICTTDHGLAFPGMKCNLTDGGIGVFLIMRGPGVPAGGVEDSLVSQVDIFPTLCDYLDLDRPQWLQGKSFLPLLNGSADTVRKEVFAEVNYHAAKEPMRGVRTRRYKYIKRFDDRKTPVLPNCDDSVSKDFRIENGWTEKERDQVMLYDLYFDPMECHNLAEDPACADIRKDLDQRLAAWMADTNDPLLDKGLTAPAGAKVTDPDGRSPGGALIDG